MENWKNGGVHFMHGKADYASNQLNVKHTTDETILEEVLPEIDTKKFEEWNMIDINFWITEKLGLNHLDM